MSISQDASDLIVTQEVTSKQAYLARYMRPTWPGGDSGVTVGIGYDCGYSSADKIADDWGSRLPANMVAILQSCAGLKGARAAVKVRSAEVQKVIVPWDAAMDEFLTVEVPSWLARVRKVYPNTEELGPDCEGALVSLAYNRGLDLKGDRRVEMRNIQTHLRNRQFEKIPAEFRSMKRLWVGKNLDGLLKRREAEARLFERGLTALRNRATS